MNLPPFLIKWINAFIGSFAFVAAGASTAPHNRVKVAVTLAVVQGFLAFPIMMMEAFHPAAKYPGWYYFVGGLLSLGGSIGACFQAKEG